ncbi:BTAD domain-containing putative transcriptional regulator [Nonomuraea sp. 3N208]|uniref:BTAD domain-containing putative transcriptional regulator n=1 Tax=Nonomuraea sp. 3N208 TaxID=3457421 RepID=UPI003FD59EA8
MSPSFRVLGPLQADVEGTPLALGPPQARAVLALLLLRPRDVVSMDKLADQLWEGQPPPSARVQMQGLLSDLRRRLGKGLIVTRAPGYLLDIPLGTVDLDLFREHVAEARRLIGEGHVAVGAARLRAGLDLWRGEPFADIRVSAVREAAEQLAELRLAAIEDRVDADLRLGGSPELLEELGDLVARHPLRERLRGYLMTALARSGRVPEALEIYHQGRKLLLDELGVKPSAELHAVHAGILRAEPGLSPSAGRPRRLQAPNTLPPDVSVFVGREALSQELIELLTPAGSRPVPLVIAVTGAGGVGKSAFAVHLATQIRDAYPDGQLYLHLQGTRSRPVSPAVALARLLRALGVPVDAVPTGLDERTELYRNLVGGRSLLLVLDDVADESQLRPLLPADSRSAVLVTSRRRLAGIENVRPVPLDLLDERESIDLLRGVLGGARVAAEPEAAGELAAYCGGLPLALRIAAARLRHRPEMTLADLAVRLGRDRLDWLEVGDVAVRASIALSYSQLDGQRRRLFRRLGLSATPEFEGWTAAALLDTDLGAAERLLDELVAVHLVEPARHGVTGPRYQLHDLIHLAAGELAAEEEPSGERRAALGRVLHGWHDLAAVADGRLPHWYDLDPAPAPGWRVPAANRAAVEANALAWFDEEAYLLGGVVRQAADEGFPQVAWPLAQRVSAYFDIRGRYDEWFDVLRDGLRAAEQAGDRLGSASMLGLLADVESSRDRYDAALANAERALVAYGKLPPGEVPVFDDEGRTGDPEVTERTKALEEARRSGDPMAVGWAAYDLIFARRNAGLSGGYLPLFEEARAAFAACGAWMSELWTVKSLGLSYFKRRRLHDAAECIARARAVIRRFQLGENALASSDIALVYAANSRFDEAERLARAELEQARTQDNPWNVARALSTVARLAHDRGDHQAAMASYLEALAIWRQLNVPSRIDATTRALAVVSDDLGDAEAAELYRAEECHAIGGA